MSAAKPDVTTRLARSPGRAVILMYHRIGEPANDPFGLAVSGSRLNEHLDLLNAVGTVRSLEELLGEVNRNRGAVTFALTFDDGYADNLHAAKPIIERWGSPVTVFVTTGCVGSASFWWDELTELLLENDNFPEQISLEVGGVDWRWERAESERPNIWDLQAILMPVEDQDRRIALTALRSQLADLSVAAPADRRPLTFDELCQLATCDLVDIGAHTQTHPVLPRLSHDRMGTEIVGSKGWLENVLTRSVTSFAYPFGEPNRSDDPAVGLVERAGFRLACSTVPAPVTHDSHRLHLPRLYVQNWDGDELERNLADLLGEPLRAAGERPRPA